MGKNFTICVGTLGMGLWRSADGGRSWARGKLWKGGYQGGRSVFELILACSHYGQLFASSDGAEWWVKLAREFTGVRGARDS
ncbi:MAG: hypothetical protein ACXW53_20065 [Candidatus Binatia bacterium]